MAKKVEQLTGLKNKIIEDKVVFGRENVVKALRNKEINSVLLASNCPKLVREEIMNLARISNIKVTEVEQDNEELGVICKKNFFVAVLGIKEE